MRIFKRRLDENHPTETRNWSAWRLFIAWAIALAVAAAILLAFRQPMANADPLPEQQSGHCQQLDEEYSNWLVNPYLQTLYWFNGSTPGVPTQTVETAADAAGADPANQASSCALPALWAASMVLGHP